MHMFTPEKLFFGGIVAMVVSVYVSQAAYRVRSESIEGLANILTLGGLAAAVIGWFQWH